MVINETFHWLWLVFCQQFHNEGWMVVLVQSCFGSSVGIGEQWDQKWDQKWDHHFASMPCEKAEGKKEPVGT